MAFMMEPIASTLTVITHGQEFSAESRARLDAIGAVILDGAVDTIVPRRDDLDVIIGETTHTFGGLLTKTDWSPAAPHTQQLGVTITDAGAVIVDAFSRTSVPGVFAAGDLAQTSDAPQPMFSVANAIATGAMAGAAAVQSLVADRIATLAVPEPAASR